MTLLLERALLLFCNSLIGKFLLFLEELKLKIVFGILIVLFLKVNLFSFFIFNNSGRFISFFALKKVFFSFFSIKLD